MRRASITHERVFSDEEDAERYANAKGHQQMAEMFGREVAKKLTSHGFQEGRILDVGCGFGATDLVLAERFADSVIVGVDLSEPLLRLARSAGHECGLGERVVFERADAQELPYEDDAFDVVINANMVHLVDAPIKMLNEMERVLAPSGHLFIADLRRSWLGFVEKEIRSGLTLSEAREMIGRSELRPGVLSRGLLWWRYEAWDENPGCVG